jgi:hypothetical protein
MPHFVQPEVHPDRGQSFMRPGAKKAGALLYVGDWDTNDVDVYDYPSGESYGAIDGNDKPYGMCVDAKGDIFIASFGSGNVREYRHGHTGVINTYSPGGELIGCSVSAKGDVAATSFDPGEVTVYAGGDPSKGTTYSDPDCGYSWTMGYDPAGDLVGVGESTSVHVCALMAGSKSETTLTESGITIDFPGGTMWDGKYIGLGDQEAGGDYQIGVWPSTISGTTITAATPEVKFSDTCDNDYADDVNPFFVGTTNVTPKTNKRATNMVGPNVDCPEQGVVDIWKYPAGGAPIKSFEINGIFANGAAVSIGTP